MIQRTLKEETLKNLNITFEKSQFYPHRKGDEPVWNCSQLYCVIDPEFLLVDFDQGENDEDNKINFYLWQNSAYTCSDDNCHCWKSKTQGQVQNFKAPQLLSRWFTVVIHELSTR